jgi:hypothetical protein
MRRLVKVDRLQSGEAGEDSPEQSVGWKHVFDEVILRIYDANVEAKINKCRIKGQG